VKTLADGLLGALAVLFLLCLGALAEACTITVQPGESIQEAIDQAPEGAVICLAEGEWVETVVVRKSLTLRGVDPDQSVIWAREPGPTVQISFPEYIQTQKVVLEDLTITGGRSQEDGFGIAVEAFAHLVLNRCTITGNRSHGLYLRNSARATVTDCVVSGNDQNGIRIQDMSRVQIEGSIVKAHPRASGVMVRDAASLTMLGTTVVNNYSSLSVLDSAEAVIADCVIEQSLLTSISLRGSARATISGCTISENALGAIWLSDSSRAAISNCILSGNAWVIMLKDSTHATIKANQILGNPLYAVTLGECIDTDDVFTGYVTGKENMGGDNVCPENLAFLFTQEGGELDWRE